MRKYSIFNELEDGARHVPLLGRIAVRRVFLEISGKNGTIVPGDVKSGDQVKGVEIDEVDGNLVGGEFAKGVGPDFG